MENNNILSINYFHILSYYIVAYLCVFASCQELIKWVILQKTFSYNKFFDPKVLKHYINRDKIKKRDETNTEEDLKNSLKHIRSLLPDSQDYSDLLYKYSKMQVNNITLPVQDYLNNKIGKYFLTHLIKSGYVKLTQEENILCPLITENYREYINQIQEYRKSI